MAPYPDQSERPGLASAFFFVVSIIVALFAFSCGKKSPPTLAAYEKPPAPVLLSAVHREDGIVLSWNFPEAGNNLISGFTIIKSSDKGLQNIRVSRGSRFFADTAFSIGSSYTFKVVAKSLTGVLSNDSNALTVTPLAPPPPPTRLSFKIEGDAVILSWEGEGSDILYNVYRRFENETFGGRPVNTSPLSHNSYRDVFHVDKTVHYTVRSLRNRAAEDEGSRSHEVTVNPFDLVPPAPRDLRYFSAPGKVFLYWKEPQERWITGYRIYRKADSSGYTLIGETQVPTFLDTGGPAGQRSYRVNAVGPSREGPGAEVGGVFFKRHDLE